MVTNQRPRERFAYQAGRFRGEAVVDAAGAGILAAMPRGSRHSQRRRQERMREQDRSRVSDGPSASGAIRVTGGYINPDHDLGWTRDQCGAYCVGRMRISWLRELLEDRHNAEHMSSKRADLFALFVAEWNITAPDFANSYVSSLDQLRPLLDEADAPFSKSSLEGARTKVWDQEPELFEVLRSGAPAHVRPHLELGEALGRLREAPPHFFVRGRGNPETVLGDAARGANVPDEWLVGLARWQQAVATRRLPQGAQCDFFDWQDRFEEAITAYVERTLSDAGAPASSETPPRPTLPEAPFLQVNTESGIGRFLGTEVLLGLRQVELLKAVHDAGGDIVPRRVLMEQLDCSDHDIDDWSSKLRKLLRAALRDEHASQLLRQHSPKEWITLLLKAKKGHGVPLGVPPDDISFD